MSDKRNKMVKNTLTKAVHSLPIPTSIKSRLKVWYSVDRFLISASKAEKAESDSDYMKQLLIERKEKFPQLYNEYENKAIAASKSSVIQNDNRDYIVQDMLFSYFAHGYTPSEYLAYGFENKEWEERKKFMSDRESVKYAYKWNNWDDIHLFMNKSETYVKFKPFYKRELISINCPEDYKKFIDFITRHNIFVKKIAIESCGRGTEPIDLSKTGKPPDVLFHDFLKESKSAGADIVLEEPVQQDPVMAEFNQSTVNTVRCMTLKTNDGIYFPFCFLRVGVNGAFVDNGGAGGLIIGIDPETGITNTDAVDENGIRYFTHPNSKKQFQNFQIPEWESMLDICREMAEQLDSIRWIGWDMAYTPKGWVVIEGNGATELIGPQSTNKFGIRSLLEQYTY